MRNEILCLTDKGEGGGVALFSLLSKIHHSLLALSYHQMFGDPWRYPVTRGIPHCPAHPWCLAVVPQGSHGNGADASQEVT